MPGYIPSTTEDVQTRLPDSPNIPGSDVAEQANMQRTSPGAPAQGNLPEAPQRSGADTLSDFLGLLQSQFQEFAHPEYYAGRTEALRQETRKRTAEDSVMGYLTQLQAAVAADPTKAVGALDNLQKFMAKQKSLPASVQPWVQKTMEQLHGMAVQEKVKEAITSYMPSAAGDQRIEIFNKMFGGLTAAGMPLKDAYTMSHGAASLYPETAARFSTEIDKDRGIVYTTDKVTGKVTTSTPEGTGSLAPVLKISDLHPEILASAESAKVDIPRLVQALNSNDPNVRELGQTVLGGLRENAIKFGVEAEERKARQKLDPTDVKLLPRAGITRDVQYVEQLSNPEKSRLQEARDVHTVELATRVELNKGLESGNLLAFTKDGEHMQATNAEVVKSMGGVVRDKATAEKIDHVRQIQTQLAQMQTHAVAAYAIMQKQGQYNPNMPLANILVNPLVRASMRNTDLNMLQSISKIVNMEAVREIIQNRITNIELAGGDYMQPQDRDSLPYIIQKLSFLQDQGKYSLASKLGQPAPEISADELHRRFPETKAIHPMSTKGGGRIN